VAAVGPLDKAKMMAAVHSIGLPTLDWSLFTQVPKVVISTLHPGRRLLEALHTLYRQDVAVDAFDPQSPGMDILSTAHKVPLLSFDRTSSADRLYILQEILRAHLDESRLQRHELEMLRALPLFTGVEGGLVAVQECEGVFWSSSTSALAIVQSAVKQLRGAQAQGPAVVAYEPSVEPLYALLEIEELTDANAVRRFVLPILGKLGPEARLATMEGLSERWGNHSADSELVTMLKEIGFVPAWHYLDGIDSAEASTAGAATGLGSTQRAWVVDTLAQPRKARDLFSPSSTDLLGVFAGPSETRCKGDIGLLVLALACSCMMCAVDTCWLSWLRLCLPDSPLSSPQPLPLFLFLSHSLSVATTNNPDISRRRRYALLTGTRCYKI
jgi:hypothetical protein